MTERRNEEASNKLRKETMKRKMGRRLGATNSYQKKKTEKEEEGRRRRGGGGRGKGRRKRGGGGGGRRRRRRRIVCLFDGCLTSQQHVSVSQGRICSDKFTCCHTEVEVADQTFYLTQSQYTDTGPTSPSADPIMPDAWQGSHWSANC